jgi:hypothetical protein
MKVKKRKFIGLLFMLVFTVKMCISLAPLFVFIDSSIAKAVIMQLEQETRDEKENVDKESFKAKKNFDDYLLAIFHFDPYLIETNYLHNREHTLLVQLYHPVVPTPPPNA